MRSARLSLAFVFLLALLCGLSWPLLSGPVSAQALRVAGIVTEAGTGRPLEGVRVTLLSPVSRDTLYESVYTDAAGRYIAGQASTVKEEGALAPSRALITAYPNPIAPSSGPLTLRYAAHPGGGVPAVDLFDVHGRRLEASLPLAGGLYFLRLRFDDGTRSAGMPVILLEGGLLALRLEPAGWAPPEETPRRASRTAGAVDPLLFVVERDGFATVAEERPAPSGTADGYDFALTAYDLSLSRAERVAAVDSVVAFWSTLDGMSAIGQNAALAAFIGAQPAFRSVGISPDLTVWALFEDGLPLVLVNNRPEGAPNHAATAGAATGVSARRSAGDGSGGLAGGLPNGTRAFVMDVAETGRDGPARVAAMLQAAGYEIAGGGVLAGTIDDFRSVHAAAVVHLSSHGALMKTFEGTDAYAIGTSSSVRRLDYDRCNRMWCDDDDWEAYYAGDLALAIYAEDAAQSNARGHWAVTSQFVQKHWSFAAEGLLFLDACTSASDAPAVVAFRAPLYAANMKHFVGWSHTVGEQLAARTVAYFFDRALGANTVEPESPPQRPFAYRDVWMHMRATGRASSGQTTLLYKQPGQDPGLLLPTVERVAVNEPAGELLVTGSFGSSGLSALSVTLGGRSLGLLSWEPDGSELVAALPAGETGDVVVALGTRASNAVPLTRWQPTIRFSADVSADYGLPDRTLTYDVSCDVPLRADVHPFRTAPGEEPLQGFASVFSGLDLRCTWRAVGAGTSPDGYAYALSGSGEVAWPLDVLKATAFSGVVDAEGILSGGRREFRLTYRLPPAPAVLTVDPPAGDNGCGTWHDPDPYQQEVSLGDVGGTVSLELDAAYGIVPGASSPAPGAAGKGHAPSGSAAARCGAPAASVAQPTVVLRVEWGAAPAVNAPSSTTKS